MTELFKFRANFKKLFLTSYLKYVTDHTTLTKEEWIQFFNNMNSTYKERVLTDVSDDIERMQFLQYLAIVHEEVVNDINLFLQMKSKKLLKNFIKECIVHAKGIMRDNHEEFPDINFQQYTEFLLIQFEPML